MKILTVIPTQGELDFFSAGAAGALVDSLSIGDVVIATETVEHDIRNRFGPPRLPRFRGAQPVRAQCRDALQTPRAFRIQYDPIASGDEAVGEVATQTAIHARTGAVAVAWEGAGGARASHVTGVSFREIRGNGQCQSHSGIRLLGGLIAVFLVDQRRVTEEAKTAVLNQKGELPILKDVDRSSAPLMRQMIEKMWRLAQVHKAGT